MKISTKGRYGLRAIIDLAINSNGEYISLASIAERQGISLNYLEHSFSSLKKAGIIMGHTGANGGYKLLHKPKDITIQTLLYVLEGDLSIIENTSFDEDTAFSRCVRTNLWDKINEKVKNIITKTTLQDIIDEQSNIPR
jgi:Rrf2 family protein